MSLRLPISGAEWPIEIRSGDEKSAFGKTKPKAREVILYMAPHAINPNNELRATLFHEAMHVAISQAGLDAILDSCPEGTEEALVGCLEQALWPLIKSNWFMKVKLPDPAAEWNLKDNSERKRG